jgi:hypothetical protein
MFVSRVSECDKNSTESKLYKYFLPLINVLLLVKYQPHFTLNIFQIQPSSVGIVTRLRAGQLSNPGPVPGMGKRYFCLLQECPDRLCGPPSLLLKSMGDAFYERKGAWAWR